jgi:hypothetical protein
LLRVHAGREGGEQRFDVAVASDDLLAIAFKHLARLLEHEQMLAPPVAHQRLANGLGIGAHVWLAQQRHFGGIPFPGDDRIHDG